jgi:hypothetical protein
MVSGTTAATKAPSRAQSADGAHGGGGPVAGLLPVIYLDPRRVAWSIS